MGVFLVVSVGCATAEPIIPDPVTELESVVSVEPEFKSLQWEYSLDIIVGHPGPAMNTWGAQGWELFHIEHAYPEEAPDVVVFLYFRRVAKKKVRRLERLERRLPETPLK